MRNIKLDFIFIIGIRVLTILLSVLFVTIFLEKFNVEDYAIYTLPSVIILVISCLEQGIQKEVLRAKSERDINKVFYVILLLSCVLYIASFLIQEILFSNLLKYSSSVVHLLIPINIVIYIFDAFIKFAYQLHGLFVNYYIASSLVMISRLYLSYYCSKSIDDFIMVNSIIGIVAIFGYFFIYNIYIGRLGVWYGVKIKQLLMILKIGRLNLIGVVYSNMDKLLLPTIVAGPIYGAYMLSSNIASYIRVAPSIVNELVYKKYSEVDGCGRFEILKKSLGINILLSLAFVIFVSLMILYRHLIELNFLDVIAESYVFYPLVIGYFVNAIYSGIYGYMIKDGENFKCLENFVLKFGFVFFVIWLFFIYLFGIVAASFGVMGINIVYWIYLLKEEKWRRLLFAFFRIGEKKSF